MLSWFRRKPPAAPVTFNERVHAFWRWYRDVAPRFHATIDAKRCADLAGETSTKVDEFLPGLAWVYGPGAEGKGHSLTVTGEGNEHRQLLARQWLALAPVIPGWTFYADRQAGPIRGHVIQMAGHDFDPAAIWVAARVDAESEKIHLTLWNHTWQLLEEKSRWTIVFLFLDEVLGESGTQRWIGEIKLGADRLADSFPLEELGEFVARTSHEFGWKKVAPGEAFTLYTIKSGPFPFPRGDVSTQITSVSALFRDYMDAEGELTNPLAGFGADYAYLSIARDCFPPGAETARRGEIEEALDEALKSAQSGACIGGAMGTERGYVDLVLFDGARSVEIVKQTVREQRLPPGTMLEYFAREKRGHRIAL